jgi:hypothetical protein
MTNIESRVLTKVKNDRNTRNMRVLDRFGHP